MVYCVDEDVVGCCEIIQYADGSAAEIASLAVDKSYRNQGIGSELVREAVKEMRSGDFRLVFALSTAASHIFTQCGFEQKSPEELTKENVKITNFRNQLCKDADCTDQEQLFRQHNHFHPVVETSLSW